MAKKASTKGLPKSVQGLAENGQRFRFPGFWLYDTKEDRIIANWLDWVTNKNENTPPEEQVNVTKAVKEFLYRLATGSESSDPIAASVDRLTDRILDLENRLSAGAILETQRQPIDEDIDDAAEVAAKLLGMED